MSPPMRSPVFYCVNVHLRKNSGIHSGIRFKFGLIPAMNVQLVRDWTFEELQEDLSIVLGRGIGKTQLYEWLKFAFIKSPTGRQRKTVYTERDRCKLSRLAQFRKEYPSASLREISLLLWQDIQENSAKYPKE